MKTAMTKMLMLVAALTGSAACLSQDREANEEPAQPEQPAQAAQPLQAPAAETSGDAICRSFMRRQRACGDPFIVALVDARVKADIPSGITQRDEDVGREALLQEARAEWAEDSRDSAIGAVCDDIASKVTPAKDAQLRNSTSACLAKQGCDAFVECAVPLNLGRWKE